VGQRDSGVDSVSRYTRLDSDSKRRLCSDGQLLDPQPSAQQQLLTPPRERLITRLLLADHSERSPLPPVLLLRLSE
jgi:hypothetical protein